MNSGSKSKIAILGPSRRFLSGISYYTEWLRDTLSEDYVVEVVFYRNLLPERLFPGRARIDDTHDEGTDWWNAFGWIKQAWCIRKHDILIVEYWSAAVSHIQILLSLLFRGRIILEMHEITEQEEKRSRILSLYSKATRCILMWLADTIIVHSKYDYHILGSNKANIS